MPINQEDLIQMRPNILEVYILSLSLSLSLNSKFMTFSGQFTAFGSSKCYQTTPEHAL